MLKRHRKPIGKMFYRMQGGRKRKFYDRESNKGTEQRPSASFYTSPQDTDAEKERTHTSSGSYQKRKRERAEAWGTIFEDLVSVGIASNVPSSFECAVCSQVTGEVYRCLDCMPHGVFCLECLRKSHQMPHLHLFEVFKLGAHWFIATSGHKPCSWHTNLKPYFNIKNGTFLIASLETPVWKRLDHICTSHYVKDMVVLDDKGRQHVRKIQFCRCESEAVTLLRSRLWPSTPKKPTVGVHVDLLDWMTALLVEGHVSTKAFCESLKWRSTKHYQMMFNFKIKDIYKVLIDECLVQYRHYQYRLRNPHVELPNTDDGTSCPACYNAPMKVYCMDADFQLVRKESSGQNIFPPKHEGRYFLKQELVDGYVNQYSTQDHQELSGQDCSSFQAASTLRTKVKTKKLDETAVFGSVCRHELPNSFFNLRHGERYYIPLLCLCFFFQEILKYVFFRVKGNISLEAFADICAKL